VEVELIPSSVGSGLINFSAAITLLRSSLGDNAMDEGQKRLFYIRLPGESYDGIDVLQAFSRSFPFFWLGCSCCISRRLLHISYRLALPGTSFLSQ